MTMWEPFCARPAEQAARPGAAMEGGDMAALMGGRGGAAPSAAVTKVFQLIGIPMPGAGGGRGAGGFGGFGGLRNATTGDYLVVLQLNGTTQKQKLRVENVGAGDTSSPFGPASGDDDDRGWWQKK